jgi:holo-[acyl-carrier protein] synthase
LIIGVGIDALEISRMARELAQDGRGFTEGLFLPEEIARGECAPQPAACFASLFAAKEALIKALSITRVDTAIYREMEVRPGPEGVRLSGRALFAARKRRVTSIRLSCVETGGLAVAAAILEA